MLCTRTFATVLVLSVASHIAFYASEAAAEVPDTAKLTMEEWASNGMTKDPVALAFDNQGRLYVAETARRGTVDIDMRAHRTWLLKDLSSDSFEKMRDAFQGWMASSLSNENKEWLTDRNGDGTHDYQDLREVTERIRLIEDTDDDGKADKSTLYASNFNEEFTGVAAGVMPYEGDVLFTVYPDLWRLRDLDGDGKADGRTIMFRGFGVHAAFDGHDLHGLTVGPEGKIYFSCGDNGFSITTKEGRKLHYPNTGGVLRMNPDGTDLEVYAYGLRNVQEFDFDKFGNMFAVDNDGDLEDERERAVYIAEGSDSGWRLNWQFRSEGWKKYNGGMTYNPWVAEGMWKPQHSDQPAYITPAMQNYSVGPGGFKFNPGTALNDEYRDFFFCVQFPVKKITAFRTQAKGAGFEMVDEHDFNTGLMVSSLNFGPDGGTYLADWIGKWSPNDEGIIYRVDDPDVRNSDIRKEVKHLINHGVSDRTELELTRLLGHEDRRVRQLAQTELVRRRRAMQLLSVARDASRAQLARVHALWGLIQLGDTAFVRKHLDELPWNDGDANVRQQLSRLTGDLHVQEALPNLRKQLTDPTPLVRSHAGIALGKLQSDEAVPELIELLRRNADLDPFIRHAAAMGLSGAGNLEELAKRANDPSPSVRIGAILALRRRASPLLERFLEDTDVRVLREAVRAIHDDLSIPTAMPAVAALLDGESLPMDEPILRRLISANHRLGQAGDRESIERLARFVSTWSATGALANAMKLEAMECLATWDHQPFVDRVEGRVREFEQRDLAAGREVLAKNVEAILRQANPEVSAATLGHAAKLNIKLSPAKLRRWAADPSVSETARIAAIQILHNDNDEGVDDLVRQLVDQPNNEPVSDLWRKAFAIHRERQPSEAFGKIRWDGSIAQQQFFVSQLPLFKTKKANAMLEQQIGRQVNAPDALAIDVLEAARTLSSSPKGLVAFEKLLAKKRHGEFSLALTGGDIERGERIYKTHVSAQCIRCHDAGGKGKQAGPELPGIAKKGRPYLLEALVDPSATIAKGYETVSILKDNGKLISGTVISETEETITLGRADGKSVTIRKEEIDDQSEATLSAMPKMTEVLSASEIRDVVEFLSTMN